MAKISSKDSLGYLLEGTNTTHLVRRINNKIIGCVYGCTLEAKIDLRMWNLSMLAVLCQNSLWFNW